LKETGKRGCSIFTNGENGDEGKGNLSGSRVGAGVRSKRRDMRLGSTEAEGKRNVLIRKGNGEVDICVGSLDICIGLLLSGNALIKPST